MTPDQYRDAIARLGLSQVAAGHLLATPRTSGRWAQGASPIPKAVALALNLMIEFEINSVDDIAVINWKQR